MSTIFSSGVRGMWPGYRGGMDDTERRAGGEGSGVGGGSSSDAPSRDDDASGRDEGIPTGRMAREEIAETERKLVRGGVRWWWLLRGSEGGEPSSTDSSGDSAVIRTRPGQPSNGQHTCETAIDPTSACYQARIPVRCPTLPSSEVSPAVVHVRSVAPSRPRELTPAPGVVPPPGGPAGLTALKTLTENGFDPILFEAEQEIGGTFQ